MNFISTKQSYHRASFNEALLTQLGVNEGLYMPEFIPQFTKDELFHLKTKTLQDVGYKVLEKFISSDIPTDTIHKIVNNALNFPITINRIGEQYVLELFHGPTLAFKDVGARILARLIENAVRKSHRTITVLVATSGDTGGAVANGFGDLENVRVVILYPQGNVSKLQEEQLTRVSANIYPIAVQGSFDECQQIVKHCFADPDLQPLHLTTANSINIGRLMGQVIYYVYTWSQFQKNNLRFIVPSGNMGNVTAGLIAKKMGIPIHSFVIACNANDPVVDYYNTGLYTAKKSVKTLSNAMDIGNPSNFERILYLCNNSWEEFTEHFCAVKVTDKETIQTIRDVYSKYQYLLDPHTAVAWKAREFVLDIYGTDIVISTASPIKFSTEIQKKTGIKVDDSEARKILEKNSKKKYIAESNYLEVKELIMNELMNK